MIKTFISLIFVIFIATATAQQQTDGITIVGDQELPQVLYIVPWRNTQMPLIKRPQITIMHQQLQLPCQREKNNSSALKSSVQWPCKNHLVVTLAVEK